MIGLFVFFMSEGALKPLEDLYLGVKRISEGNFSYEISIKKSKFSKFLNKIFPFRSSGSGGEIEMLAHQFNHMSRSIQERTMELRRSERLATIGKISSEITHEIRNPLNSISLNLSLLEDEPHDSIESKELLNSIKKEVDRLSNVTRSYLNYIKPVNVAFSEESLNEIIWSVYDIFKKEFEQKKIDFQINIPSEDVVVPVDRDLFHRVLINLVKNAAEACDEQNNNIPKKVSINLSRTKNSCIISIVDNGSGIDRDDMDKIFLPFYTRKPGGTGLGLCISYEIINKMGGNLNCSSIPAPNHRSSNKETSFTITLPSKMNLESV